MEKQIKIVLGTVSAILVLVACIYLGVLTRNSLKAYGYIGASPTERDTIAISGEGKVTAIPDIATVMLGFTAEKKTVAPAQKENTEKMNKLIAALKAMNIDAKDIKTQNYNIYPAYDYTRGKQELRGYVVSQNLLVKIRDLDKVGDVLAKVSELELNQVGDVSFTIDEPEKLKEEARAKALANAKSKAETLAKQAGVKLGKVVSFSENYDSYPRPMYSYAEKAIGVGGGAEAPAIEPGSQDINVSVMVSWEILN